MRLEIGSITFQSSFRSIVLAFIHVPFMHLRLRAFTLEQESFGKDYRMRPPTLSASGQTPV